MSFKSILEKFKNNELSKSVLLNVLLKPIGMIISFLYTPLLLNYLGDEKYGVWVTVLSIVNWVAYFDAGIGNGLRNKLSSEIATKRFNEAKKSISTAYIVMFVLVSVFYIAGIVIGSLLNWNVLLNTDLKINNVLFISFTFVCINFYLSLYTNGYFAIQKSEAVALSGLIVQALNLLGVLLFMFSNINESLLSISYLFGITSIFTSILFSLVLWEKYKYLRVDVHLYDRSSLKDICSLGFKFFFVQIAALILFTTDSLIISYLFNPTFVTPYNTVFKAFGIVQSLFVAFLTPYWSRFTVAKVNKEYDWMKKTISKIKRLWVVCSILLIMLVPIFPFISDVWLKKQLIYDKGLVLSMAIYYILLIYSSIYSTALNGLGNINVQLVCSIIAAIINIPLSVFFAKGCGMGTTGVCLGTIISLLGGDIIYTIQMNGIIRKGLQQ